MTGNPCFASLNVLVQPHTRQVWVGDGLRTPEPKVFELLAYLVQRSGIAVRKGELLAEIWPGETVEESALTRCMSCLRNLLEDDAKNPRFIRTVQRFGYEFIAPVEIVDGLIGPIGAGRRSSGHQRDTARLPLPQRSQNAPFETMLDEIIVEFDSLGTNAGISNGSSLHSVSRKGAVCLEIGSRASRDRRTGSYITCSAFTEDGRYCV